MARLREACAGVAHQVWIDVSLLEYAPHALEHMGVDVARAVSEIGGNATLHLGAVNEMPLPINLFDKPAVACNSDAFPCRRRVHNRSEFRGFASYGEFLVFLEHRVELEGVCDSLPG